MVHSWVQATDESGSAGCVYLVGLPSGGVITFTSQVIASQNGGPFQLVFLKELSLTLSSLFLGSMISNHQDQMCEVCR